ncbi:carotenoid cleavage dioxygenase 8, chloroplastic-like [Capsicum annuum]|nr:carotenoid cleavage dioxygenase 8, chloroplastic-like [Capsicum annuum]
MILGVDPGVPCAKNQPGRARDVKDHPSMGSSTPLSNTHPQSPSNHHTKISVNVVGNVGNAIAQTILTQDLVDELVVVDAKPFKLRGKMLDLQHAAAFLPRLNLLLSNLAMYKDTEFSSYLNYLISVAGGSIGGSNSSTVSSELMHCFGTGASEMIHCSELRLQKVAMVRNDASEVCIVPKLVKYSPECILLIVSNPVDVLTYVAWKLSEFTANRVIGSGTNLDSSRFLFLIGDHPDVNDQDVQKVTGSSLGNSLRQKCKAYIVGEHGDSSVALWSSISVGGIPLLSFLERQQISIEKETLENIHKQHVLELACTAW